MDCSIYDHCYYFFSDELLLQEDSSEVSSLAFGITNNMRLGNATDALSSREAGTSSQGLNQARTSSNFVSTNPRYVLFLN